MGRGSKSNSYFSPHDSNTICDITGFEIKKSQAIKTWKGLYVTAEAWSERHPQDFPVIPKPQRIVENVRTEDLTTDAVQTFDII